MRGEREGKEETGEWTLMIGPPGISREENRGRKEETKTSIIICQSSKEISLTQASAR